MHFFVSLADGWQWLINDTLRNLHLMSSQSREQIKVWQAGFWCLHGTQRVIHMFSVCLKGLCYCGSLVCAAVIPGSTVTTCGLVDGVVCVT